MDKTAFSCEEECRRKEQQELADKKNIIEKVIANVLNNDDEGYSKIKQIAKESVKAVLAESKELISISFAALLQTLKTDPQMAKLIQNIASTNEGEQHDDNNIIKYLESNRNSLSDLAEKHNENLVEALTNNAVDNT